MMKMVFLNDQYRTISGKEALSVVISFIYNLQRVLPEECINGKDWNDDKYASVHYPLLGEQYMTVNEGILDSLEKEYADKQIKLQVRSTHSKKAWSLCFNKQHTHNNTNISYNVQAATSRRLERNYSYSLPHNLANT